MRKLVELIEHRQFIEHSRHIRGDNRGLDGRRIDGRRLDGRADWRPARVRPAVSLGREGGVPTTSTTTADSGAEHQKVAVKVCNTQLTPQGEIQCGQQAASDPKAIAMIASIIVISVQPFVAELQKAGLPNVNPSASAPQCSTSPICFPLAADYLAQAGCALMMPRAVHATKIGFAYHLDTGLRRGVEHRDRVGQQGRLHLGRHVSLPDHIDRRDAIRLATRRQEPAGRDARRLAAGYRRLACRRSEYRQDRAHVHDGRPARPRSSPGLGSAARQLLRRRVLSRPDLDRLPDARAVPPAGGGGGRDG